MKKSELILLFSGLALSSLLYSQPPLPPGGNRGDSLRNEGDLPGAIAEYRKMHSAKPGDRTITYNFACLFSLGKQVDSCYRYLDLWVKSAASLDALMDPDLINARKDKRWTDFENRLLASVSAGGGEKIKDTGFASALWRLQAYDQAYFTEVGIAAKKVGMKSSTVEAIWDLKALINEKNQADLEALLTGKGWPKASEVGQDAVMAAYLVVQHSTSGLQYKYLPDVKRSCEAGELPWERYALMYDRALHNDGKPQKYGTHTLYNEKTRLPELYPLQDPSKVDEWRRELGMEPLSAYLSKYGIKWEPPK
ncbi:MAG: hypothetical protein MUD02_02720 [Bacteroidales bacterium]|nr:hypothetical protein [Bacteroidales bacterium]